MNVMHMKYAVEVAKAGSLSKASETLLIAQPNLSRSIKELEADLGIRIFARTSKGMTLTPDGEEFISYASDILGQLDDIETMYKAGIPARQVFSISVPRADYIADAFAEFSNHLSKESAEIYYMETNAGKTIKNIVEHNYKMGIIRYSSNFDRYFKSLLEGKGLSYELVAEFTDVLVMNKDHPLAQKEEILLEDLKPYIEISLADAYVPSLPVFDGTKDERTPGCRRHIYVYERAGLFHLFSRNPQAFMWTDPVSEDVANRFGLTQRACSDCRKLFKDVLIRKKNYKYSNLDKQFITELCNSRRRQSWVIK